MSQVRMPGIHLEAYLEVMGAMGKETYEATCFHAGDIVRYDNLGPLPGDNGNAVWVGMGTATRRITLTRETMALVTAVEKHGNHLIYTIRHINLLAEGGGEEDNEECSFEHNSPHHSWLVLTGCQHVDNCRWDLLLV